MSIIKRLNKIKPWLLPLNLVLIGVLGFGLGRWSKVEEAKTPVLIENPVGDSAPAALGASDSTDPASTLVSAKSDTFVGSRNGTKYHYPWCSGAQRIKEENKIWFASADQARGAGYTPAANCPGL